MCSVISLEERRLQKTRGIGGVEPVGIDERIRSLKASFARIDALLAELRGPTPEMKEEKPRIENPGDETP